jgi:hypothetical protein
MEEGGKKGRDVIFLFSGCLALKNSIAQSPAIVCGGIPMQMVLRYSDSDLSRL